MSDFVRAPLLKKLNKDNYLSRIERTEKLLRPKPSATVNALSEFSDDMGSVGRGQLQLRSDGIASVIRLNRILLFVDLATPTIALPNGCLSNSNIVEVVLTGQFFQNTGVAQTITPRFYIGKSASETLVTSDTALSVASGSTRRSFVYTVRVSAAPQGGNYVQCDEDWRLETATAGTAGVIIKTTRSTNIIDIDNLGDVNSCFFRIANGAASTLFKVFTNTVSVRILDAEPLDEIHWYSQPDATTGIDTQILSDFATTNYSTSTTFRIGEPNSGVGTELARSLIKFSDLANFLTDPDLQDFIITNAYLYVTIATDSSDNAATCDVFQIIVPWTVSETTWNKASAAVNWAAAGLLAGTDYNSTVLASASFTASETIGSVKYFQFNASGLAVLQSIIAGTTTDYGFFLKMQTELNNSYTLQSSNSATPDLAPILHIIGYKP